MYKIFPSLVSDQIVRLLLHSYSLTPSTLPAPCPCPREAAFHPLAQSTQVVDPSLPTATLPPLTDRASVRAPLKEMYLCQLTRRKKRRKALCSSSSGEERVPKFSRSFTKYLFLLRKLSNS